MNKALKTASMIAFSALVLGFLPAASLEAQAKRLCCVSGEYEGFQVAAPKPNCPAPVKEKFRMVVKQTAPCAAEIGGTITDSAGTVNDWKGTLSRGLGACCQFQGSFLTPSGNTIEFKGTICQKLGKWKAEGTWEELRSPDHCKSGGTWQMTQI